MKLFKRSSAKGGSMNVLLSIRPVFVERILNGSKKYEFRRTPFRASVRRVEIYASAPVKKIVGSFVPGKILMDTPNRLWELLWKDSGLSEEEFFGYFRGAQIGFAIPIARIESYNPSIDPYRESPSFRAPQSFVYRKNSFPLFPDLAFPETT